ncbi:MAG: cysteine desulfurase [Alphaproteobacteria bacterium]|nr:MAG: cysteine desulfurase [Alphaproteobacteria bacterium]
MRFAHSLNESLNLSVRSVYLDYNATTPPDSAVLADMEPFFTDIWGNPSSVHHIGRRARACLDDFRDRAATVFNSKPSEIVFTSGGTESNNLAVLGTARLLRDKGRHLITSTIEHHAVLHCFDYLERFEGFQVTRLPVDSSGRLDPEDLRNAITDSTTLVSVMAANNETGVIQPVAELGRICRERGVIFHTDAVQWFGKEPFHDVAQFNADLVSICAHKFHGPRGAGALYIRSPLQPHPTAFGGAHESERRAGTENLPAIAGLVSAMERFIPVPVFDRAVLEPLRIKIIDTVNSIESATFRGSLTHSLSNTVSFTVTGCDSIALMAALDMEGICASSGSACAAGSLEPSHVMRAMGVSEAESNALVRFSLGRESTNEEIDYLLKLLPGILSQVKTPE